MTASLDKGSFTFLALDLKSAFYPESSSSFYFRVVFRKQLLGLRCAHYHIYCLHSYLSIFMENHWFTPVHLIPSDTVEFILIFSLFIFVHLFMIVRNLTPMTLNMFTYLITPCVGTVLPLLLPPLLTLLRPQHLVLGFPPTWMSLFNLHEL